MELSTSTAETWLDRVTRWRGSNESAEVFSQREGYAASTLRCWASKLRHQLASAPPVQLARVVRTPTRTTAPATGPSSAIVIEVVGGCVRISVEAGADPQTLAMVLEAVRVGGRQ